MGKALQTNVMKQRFSERKEGTYPDDDFEAYEQQYLALPYSGSDSIEFEISLSQLGQPDEKVILLPVSDKFVHMIEKFLEIKPLLCVKARPTHRQRKTCLSCIFREVDSAILMTDDSYTEMTLLFVETSIVREDIRECRTPKVCWSIDYATTDICQRFLNAHAVNPTFYPELVTMKSPIVPSRMCILVYAGTCRGKRSTKYCLQCLSSQHIEYLYPGSYPTSPTQRLLWTKKLRKEARIVLTHLLSDCKTIWLCKKLQRLPDTICTQHIEYLKSSSEEAVDTPYKRIPDELWPPTYPGHHDHYDFDNRAVLLVRFMAEEAATCIRCLVLYSEGFFAFADGNPIRYGYVWMTQNHDNIIQICRMSASMKLWLYQGAEPLQPGDMLALCIADIQDFFPSIEKVK